MRKAVFWRFSRAYPRPSGGTTPRPKQRGHLAGLSPPERGNLRCFLAFCESSGPIPARAGEPYQRDYWRLCHRAYPRPSGGTLTVCIRRNRNQGLSPPERGNLNEEGTQKKVEGPIPARAGEPLTNSSGLPQ